MSDHAQIIIKIAERCNLDCTYCYMYTAGDQSWRARPAFLSPELRARFIDRCAAFLDAEPHRQLTLEFHGGEPLLLGRTAFGELLTEVRTRLDPERVFVCLQTNGTLLDEDWCSLFETHRVHWSISCDGPASVNDRFRRTHTGESSLAAVERAIRLSMGRPSGRFGGVLAVIDPTSSAHEVVTWFRALGVRDFDLLMPDASHAAPPAHLPGFTMEGLKRYLIEAFDTWIAFGDDRFRIRLFTHIMRALFGLRSGLDAFGGDLWGMLVVESDGSYQFLDVMRIHGLDEVATGMNLVEHSLDEYMQRTQGKLPGACETCRACPVFKVCGGGYLPHRYDGESYDRPSVYCDVLYDLIAHIHQYLQGVTPPEMWTPRETLVAEA